MSNPLHLESANACETLEPRRLLSVAGDFAVVDGENLRITADDNDNVLVVTFERPAADQPGRFNVQLDGQSVAVPAVGLRFLELNLGAGNDSAFLAVGLHARVVAGAGDDTVSTGSGFDSIIGGAGNDSIIAGPGSDRVDGGPGDDFTSGGSDYDRLSGSEGADTIFGAGSPDTIEGGDGDDLLDGGSDGDFLYGDAGEEPAPNPGNDMLFGRGGKDHLDGGPGADLIDGGSAPIPVSGFSPGDEADYSARTEDLQITLG